MAAHGLDCACGDCSHPTGGFAFFDRTPASRKPGAVECSECGRDAVCTIHTRDRYVPLGSDSGYDGHDVPVHEPFCDECASELHPNAERLELEK